MKGNFTIVNLPGGFWSEGKRYQEVEICELSGYDQEYLKSAYKIQSQAKWTTLLLTRSIKRIGPFITITPELVKTLTLGDREALLLYIRRMTFGDKLNCVIDCTNENCEEQIGLDLKVGDLLLPSYPKAQERYQKTITYKGVKYKVDFRLPTGLDQEEIARTAKEDPEAASGYLIKACILKTNKNAKESTGKIPPLVYDEVFNSIDQLDPQAEIRFKIKCPECDTEFNTILDAGIYFRNELHYNIKELYNEIHFLAYHYHWSEQEIMAMSIDKRRLYCDMLLNAISEEVMQ